MHEAPRKPAGKGRGRWVCLLWGLVAALLPPLSASAWAGFSCQSLVWPTDYPYTWSYTSTNGNYSQYIHIRGHDKQSDGVNANDCWGGGTTSWGISFGVENYTNQPTTSGGAGQPSDLSITAYRLKLYDSSGPTLVHTENIASGDLNQWFDQNGSNYSSTMAYLTPGKRGVG